MAVAAVAAGALRIGSMFARGAGSVLSGGARGVGRSGGMLRRAVLKKTKVKRENIARSRSFNKKLIERNKRRQKEKTIETFSIKKPRLGSIPGKSFFEKILDFIGTLFLGWLFNNLPKIIKFVEDLKKRINLLIDSLKSFVENVGKWFTALKDNIVARWENIKSFDFTDQSGKIKKSMDDLEKAFIGMSNDFDSAKRAMLDEMGEDSGGGSYTPGEVPEEVSSDTEFTTAVTNLAKKYDLNEDDLYAVMSFETGGTFDPAKKNMAGSGATGLIQFTNSTARGLGTTTEALARMSRTEQLKYVDKYFSNKGIQGGNIEDLYMSILFPAAVGKPSNFVLFGRGAIAGYGPGSRAYSQNRGLDRNNDGSVTKAEASAAARAHKKGGSGGRYGGGGNVVEYITGDRRHPNFEYSGHGRAYNYHDHIAFRTIQEKERAKAALRAAGIKIGSEYIGRENDPGWHGANLAIDIPGGQWGGSGAIGQREYNGSARVRQVLTNAGFGGAGLGHGSSAISRSPGVMPDIGYSKGPQNTILIIEEEAPPPMMMGQSGGSSPIIVMGASLNSIMKRKLLTDLAYT